MPNISIYNKAYALTDSMTELTGTLHTIQDLVDTTSEENRVFAEYCLSALELCSKCIANLAEQIQTIKNS